jgi:hypothetical protein
VQSRTCKFAIRFSAKSSALKYPLYIYDAGSECNRLTSVAIVASTFELSDGETMHGNGGKDAE